MGLSTKDFATICRNMGRDPMAELGKAEGAPKATKSRMNKWEQLYAEELNSRFRIGLILWFQFEGMRFRLADGAYYKPDFVALSHTGELLVYECKGFWREAARVRIKVAADRHPFRFIAVRKRLVKEGGGWQEECFAAALDRIAVIRRTLEQK